MEDAISLSNLTERGSDFNYQEQYIFEIHSKSIKTLRTLNFVLRSASHIYLYHKIEKLQKYILRSIRNFLIYTTNLNRINL